MTDATPKAVPTPEMVEKARELVEMRVCCVDAGRCRVDAFAECIARALHEIEQAAEQRGAERMREAAASECMLVGGDWRDADIEHKAYAANYLADRIRALPLAEPGKGE